MGFWTFVFLVVAMGIGTEFVIRIVKLGARHYENIKRIEHGYPTLDGSVSMRAGSIHEEYEHAHAHDGRLQ